MRKLLKEQKQNLLLKQAQQAKSILEKEEPTSSKKSLSYKVPFLGSQTAENSPLLQTVSDFGKNPPPFKPPIDEVDVPRRSLLQHLSPGPSKLPNIVTFGSEGTEEI